MARAGVGREGVTLDASISPSSSKNVEHDARESEDESEGEGERAKVLAACPASFGSKKRKLDDGEGVPSKTGSVVTNESSRLTTMNVAGRAGDEGRGGDGVGLGADEGEVGPATSLSEGERVASPGTPPAQVVPPLGGSPGGSLSPPPAPKKIYPKRDLRKARKEVARRLEF